MEKIVEYTLKEKIDKLEGLRTYISAKVDDLLYNKNRSDDRFRRIMETVDNVEKIINDLADISFYGEYSPYNPIHHLNEYIYGVKRFKDEAEGQLKRLNTEIVDMNNRLEEIMKDIESLKKAIMIKGD